MAIFSFYGTAKDSLEWLRQLVELDRFVFVLERVYTNDEVFQFTKLTQSVLEKIGSPISLLLFSTEYSRYPPQLGKPDSLGRMTIDPTYSGPALDITLPKTYRKDDRTGLGMGRLIYQPVYFVPSSSNRVYKPPMQLKRDYVQVQKLLKKNMTRIFAKNLVFKEHTFLDQVESYWVGSEALRLLESGQADILQGPEWRWVMGKDVRRSKEEL